MGELKRFSLLAIMAGIVIAVALAADDPTFKMVGSGCSPHMIINATAFADNLDSVLQSLLSNISDGFATAIQNRSGKTDPVYGLAVCRKYLNASECSQCVKKASTEAKALCPGVNGARVHFDGCLLRYENNSFSSQAVDAGNYVYCASLFDNNPQEFLDKAQELSTQLITNASAKNGYAVGYIDGSIYGLAQCWPSLTNTSCQECLTEAQNQLLTCPPKLEGRGLEAGCFMRYSTYSFFTNNQTSTSPNLTSSSGQSSSKLVPILLGSIGGAALVGAMCLILFCLRNRQRKNYNPTDENQAARGNFEQFVFDYEVLRNSTENFDRNNMLGKGGFGEVYKGKLPDGRVVAVKKLIGRHETTQAAEEFLREVSILTSVRHRNLVRLLGCCTQGHDRLLVYEFMSNNSLDKHLFEIRSSLSWDRRLNIIVGTARGIAYLHEDSEVCIIHREIKCGNILLDDNFCPKIADFGLARFFPEDETHVSTRVGGTIGYTAPEYAVHGQLTEKADVYSYGILILEIVSGRKCMDARLPEPMQILLQWVWNKYEQGQVLEIVDPTLEGKYPREQALRVIAIALLCTQGSWALRPTMSEVASMLTNNLEIPGQPTQPAFIDSFSPSVTKSTSKSENSGPTTPPVHESHGSITVSLSPR